MGHTDKNTDIRQRRMGFDRTQQRPQAVVLQDDRNAGVQARQGAQGDGPYLCNVLIGRVRLHGSQDCGNATGS